MRKRSGGMIPIGRDGEPLLTRSGVAKLLGRSVSSVIRFERAKKLRPRLSHGVHIFDREEVDTLSSELGARPSSSPAHVGRRSEAQRAAAAWKMYGDGKSVFDVVLELEMHPDEARRLAATFEAPGHVVLPPNVVQELASEGCGDKGARVSAASVLASVRTLRDRIRKLRNPI